MTQQPPDPALMAAIGDYQIIPMTGALEQGLGPLLLGTEGFKVGTEPAVMWSDVTELAVEVEDDQDLPYGLLYACVRDRSLVLGIAFSRRLVDERAALVREAFERYLANTGTAWGDRPYLDLPAALDSLPDSSELDESTGEPSWRSEIGGTVGERVAREMRLNLEALVFAVPCVATILLAYQAQRDLPDVSLLSAVEGLLAVCAGTVCFLILRRWWTKA